MQLVALNIYGKFDLYTWVPGNELTKHGAVTKLEVVQKIAQGQDVRLFCVQTQQYSNLWATKKRGAFYLRTDPIHQPDDCFFISAEAPRVEPIDKYIPTPWAVSSYPSSHP